MQQVNLLKQYEAFNGEREARRAAYRSRRPMLAVIQGGAAAEAPPLRAPLAPADTAAEVEGIVFDYFASSPEGREAIALTARAQAGR